MTIKKLDYDAILIDRYDDIETVARRLKDSDLDNAVLIHEDATHCDIAEWLCETPIDARGIIEEMERLLKPPQKQLVSFEKIPRNNIFETAIVSDIDYSERLTDILNIVEDEKRMENLIIFVEDNPDIHIGLLHKITVDSYFGDGFGILYTFAYPFSQFIKD